MFPPVKQMLSFSYEPEEDVTFLNTKWQVEAFQTSFKKQEK